MEDVVRVQSIGGRLSLLFSPFEFLVSSQAINEGQKRDILLEVGYGHYFRVESANVVS